jgi:hypothetical protein
MPLPKINLPIYEIKLPSTGEKVKFRPFTMKEEKILLTAQETKETEQVLLSIKQVLNNCLINKSVDDLAVFDVEYLLITANIKDLNYFGGNMTYPLFNFQNNQEPKYHSRPSLYESACLPRKYQIASEHTRADPD